MTRKSSMVGTVCGHVISSAGSDPAGTENSPVTGTLPFVKILVKFRTRMVKMCGLRGLERVIKMSHVKKRFVIFDILGVGRKVYIFFKFEGKNSIIHKPEVKTTNQLLSKKN